jgi:hypothetical protein
MEAPLDLTGWRRNTLIKMIQEKLSGFSLTYFSSRKNSPGVGNKINNINPETRQNPKQNRKSTTAHNQPNSVSNVLGNHRPKA